MPKSIIVVIIIGIAATVAAASFVLLRAPVQKRAQLILNNFSFWYGGGPTGNKAISGLPFR